MSGQDVTTHEAVVDAARRGVPVDFTPVVEVSTGPGDGHDPDGNGDRRGRAGAPGPFPVDVRRLARTGTGSTTRPTLPSYDDEAAWADRTVDGRWLAALLAGGEANIHPHGLVVQGARIVGGLYLTGATLRSRLRLLDCQLGEHMVVLRDARARTVDLSGSHCGGIDADRAHVDGALVLHDTTIDGSLRLVDADVDASVELMGARIDAGQDVAIDADRARIAGSLLFGAGFAAYGQIRLSAATIGGDLTGRGAQLHHPGLVALHAIGVEVSGSVVLRDGFTAQGSVRLTGAQVGRDVDGSDARLVNPDGDALSLDAARVGGGVFLRRTEAMGRVRLVNSEIGGDLSCGGARLERPSDMALYASRAKIAGNVWLDEGFASVGQVRLSGVTIGGRLRCGSASMSDLTPGGAALDANTARIGGEVHLDEGFTSEGQVRFASATIGAGLDCRGARIVRVDGTSGDASADPGRVVPAFDMRGARVATNALFMDCDITGTLRFTGASIAGDANFRRARLANPDHIALHGSGSHVGGTVFLTDGFEVDGEVRLLGITINRDLVAVRGRIASTERNAIGLTRARITGDVLLGRELVVSGRVQLARAVVGGNLDCAGGSFTRREGAAIDASHASVSGAVVLSAATSVAGELHMSGVNVSGSLDLGGAQFTNPDSEHPALGAINARIGGGIYSQGTLDGGVELRGVTVGGDLDFGGAHLLASGYRAALAADRAQVAGSLLLNRGFRANGGVVVRSATIGGHASCGEGTFDHPRGRALSFAGSRIGGDLVLSGRFRADGSTNLPGSTIDGDVVCTDGHFSSADDDRALYAAGARIAGTLRLDGRFRADGAVVLRGARVATLQDEQASWPDRINLDGFHYDRLVCPSGDRGWRVRRDWLRRQTTPSAQGYVQLAAVYRSAGDELDARRILIERHNALLRPPPEWHSQLPHGVMEVVRRAWRWVLRLTIGHGFAPGRSLLIAMPLVVGLALWLAHAQQQDMLIPTDDTAVTVTGDGAGAPRASVCDDRYPCVQPVVYALDNMVPIIELGQRSRWTPDQSHRGATWFDDGRWLAIAAWTTSAIGWVLATLVAASFTQIVRRE